MAKGKRLSIYGNWSAYDELSDGVPLTEELAMRQFDEMLRLRGLGARFDAYLMDAFWFAPDGGYRQWRTPNWPEGPDRWLDRCRANGILPGLWFTANTLCHLEPASQWSDSADEDQWGLCCFTGGFMADYLEVLDNWYARGVRIFKIDFASFGAAPASVKAEMSEYAIRRRNVDAFRSAIVGFRANHPDALFMAFNGFEWVEYMNRTDRPLAHLPGLEWQEAVDEGLQLVDPNWLAAFDSIYSGDPRPADVPTAPFWRSVDIYGDHTTRVLEEAGLPLNRIDSCGFMAGPTGTCYWRGKAMWKGMLILTLARGGDLTVFYGDLSLFDDEDGRWMASVQALFEVAYAAGPSSSFGGIPGAIEPYGWLVGERLCAVVNPRPERALVPIPAGQWSLAFCDVGLVPEVYPEQIVLGPFQMALLSRDPVDLGVQNDCMIVEMSPAAFEIVEQSKGKLVAEAAGKDMRIVAAIRDKSDGLVRNFPPADNPVLSLSIAVSLEAGAFSVDDHCARKIWSGASWRCVDVSADEVGVYRFECTSSDPDVDRIELRLWHRS